MIDKRFPILNSSSLFWHELWHEYWHEYVARNLEMLTHSLSAFFWFLLDRLGEDTPLSCEDWENSAALFGFLAAFSSSSSSPPELKMSEPLKGQVNIMARIVA